MHFWTTATSQSCNITFQCCAQLCALCILRYIAVAFAALTWARQQLGADISCLDKIVYTLAASSKDDGDSMMLMQLLPVCTRPWCL